MSGSLNKAIIVGNLGRDPEVRTTQRGDKVANLAIATSERWRDQAGETQEKTEWHRVVLFGKIAEVAERYLARGSKVLIEGKLQTRKWQDNTGNDRYTTEIIVSGYGGGMTMLDSRGSRASESPSQDTQGFGSGAAIDPPADNFGTGAADFNNDLDDEIPF